jgi:aspartyl-tRNA(Asn)/glutamyl-tRNA(Gln) amidotransferase subunit A
VRIPAALRGVVGMKPTYDLVSRLSQALDHVGPMTRSVRDNALMLGLIAGRLAASYTELLESSIRGKTVGIAMEFYDCLLSEEVRRVLDAACEAFRDARANVVSVFVPNIEAIYDAQQFVLKAEAYAEHRSALLKGASYQDEVRERLMKGASVGRLIRFWSRSILSSVQAVALPRL